jgi:hypothetical protein
MLSVKQQQEVPKVLAQTHASIDAIAKHDFAPCFELDAKCKADSNLLAEFIKDPAGVALREVGYTPPQGFHMHFVDKENNYFPQEGDAISQLASGEHGKIWTRIEIRTAAGPGCIINCGWCS